MIYASWFHHPHTKISHKKKHFKQLQVILVSYISIISAIQSYGQLFITIQFAEIKNKVQSIFLKNGMQAIP